jgi:eukaryotic-like serine/threonine-protein kinase
MSEHTATGEFRPRAWEGSQEKPALTGYEILEEMGRGGMGVVYKARQISLNRLVAVKLIRDGALASDQDRTRFRIEAEAAARMTHPHIVRIYEMGEDQGRPYLAMELIEGGSLEQHLNGQPVEPRQAAELLRALALAIDHAHQRHIVHRDLKPANILLSAQSSLHSAQKTGIPLSTEHSALSILFPKITDFGLAKRLDRDSTAVTRDGTVLGTAAYMAPEQAAGRVHEIRPAVDIYALGAIFYELLTGRLPFVAETWNQTVDQVLHDQPTLPTRWNAAIPQDLETVCLKCLEKEAEQRYASAKELADDLGYYLAQQPVLAVRVSEQELLARLARKDGYHHLEEVGCGPGSVVYRAVFGPLQQPVSLKVFKSCNTSQEVWEERLQQASASWSVLTHPHIILNQRAGWWDAMPYASTEYCPLGSLAGKLNGKPWSVQQAMALVEKLAEVVSYLHRQGVVHGNLKPSNILFAADDIPRLTDFYQLGGLYRTTIPIDGPIPVGFAYLAPELIKDPLAEPGIYTDLYGLGMILYELLTGQAPFLAETLQELKEQILTLEPVLPSQLNPKVPTALDTLCMRCLNKSPWRRYYRAYDVSARLLAFQQEG